jgi:hypothetical protein
MPSTFEGVAVPEIPEVDLILDGWPEGLREPLVWTFGPVSPAAPAVIVVASRRRRDGDARGYRR